MPADTDIILDAGNIKGPDPNNLVSMFSLAQQVQQAKQESAKRNALLQTFSDPNSVDPATGSPTPQAIRKVMSVDPEMGLKLQDDSLNAQVQRAQLQHSKTEAGKNNWDFMSQVAGVGYDAYDDAIKAGKPQAEAVSAGQAARNDAAKNNGGVVGDDVVDGIIGKPFDPTGAKALAGSNKEWLAGQTEKIRAKQEADKEADDRAKQDAENRRLDEQAKRDADAARAAADKGWSDPYTTKDGKTISINKNTGETREIKDVEGLKRVGSGSGADFTPKMGELMAATAEQGVSLPTGFRSKAQQVELYQGLLDRNPDKTPDQIASMLKSGQIEFGAQKKETQTAANIAGKVQVFANELDKNLPLLRNAAKDVPRENWMDLTKLLQTGDEHISDPKLKTLKGYINSTMQAYDGLGSRGGMDKDKREANRKLLLSADGPEAFEAQLKVFEKEAQIAKASAYEATKSPELEDQSGAKPAGGKVDHSKMSDADLKKSLGLP